MMGIAKASLEAAVKDHGQLIKLSEGRTPDKAGVTIEEVGNTCAFLVSALAAGIVGDIIYVDRGLPEQLQRTL
ncbi:hypothetical protein A5881_002342 [Enterococcus termitis]|nr:hypothetical protein A5881_001340 [Enterococcus termitis]